MAAGNLYAINAAGELVEMKPSAPQDEDQMQQLIARHPAVIGDDDGELLLVQREQSIADGESTGRWSLDHLYVTTAGVPVLVEVKRAVDTRLRREVVGQMLDYAANGTAYWDAGTIAGSFYETASEHLLDPDEVLSAFLGDDRDPSEFWDQVDANFAAGRVKLVFVADRIPSELARIVEFLDEQMRADVRAVELRWFEGADGTMALNPRIIGVSERARLAKRSGQSKTPLTISEWIERTSLSDEARLAAPKFIDLIENAGGTVTVTKAQAALVAIVSRAEPVYPLSFRKDRSGSIQVHFERLARTKAYADESARQTLYADLTAIVGPLFSENIDGHPGFPAEVLNDGEALAALSSLIDALFRRLGSTSGRSAPAYLASELLGQLGHRLEQVRDQADVRDLEDRVLLFVDRDDDLGILHRRKVLDRC